GCTDHDKAVIATCLDTVSAVAALPGGGGKISVLAGERSSGTVYTVSPDSERTKVAELDVDAAGDGGLTALAPSPTYREDRLIFAYITTAEDNRVVRFSPGQPAEPVLTRIPKGATHNRGALLAEDSGTLLVATGDAGDADAAEDRDSLAGKVLRINTSGDPASTNPHGDSPVIASGVHAPGGLCTPGDDSADAPERDPDRRLWKTDPRKNQGTVMLV